MNRTSLYIGTATEKKEGVEYISFIETKPRSFDSFQIKHQFFDMAEYTHIIFTSKNTVQFFLQAFEYFGFDKSFLKDKIFFCIGDRTAKPLMNFCDVEVVLPEESTQEGLVDVISLYDLNNAYIFFPRSSRARAYLSNVLRRWGIRVQLCDLYDTKTKIPEKLPDLNNFQEIIFSSPSTVDAFFAIFPDKPKHLKLTPIGPITTRYLQKFSNKME